MLLKYITSHNLNKQGDSYIFMNHDGGLDVVVVDTTVDNYYINIPQKLAMCGVDMDSIVSVSFFGSHVYKSSNSNSDIDLIVITDQQSIITDNFIIKSDVHDALTLNVKIYTPVGFQLSLDEHDISAVETFFMPKSYILLGSLDGFTFNLDKGKLRSSISQVVTHSWHKGKQKLVKVGDYDKNAGIKSVFHSLRILDLGIQVASTGSIYDFSRMNYVLLDIVKLSGEYTRNELWSKISSKYLGDYKRLRTKFKELAPKEDTDSFKEVEQIRNLIKKYKLQLGDKEKEFIKDIKNML